eukprot:15122791-Heterocapsa_arctica.AAC.1
MQHRVRVGLRCTQVPRPVLGDKIYFTMKQGTAEETKHEIRVRPDRTAEVRHRNKIMGKLWEQLEKHIASAAPGSKVGQNGPKGK